MVPRLTPNGLNLRTLVELIRRRADECQLTFFRQHQQQILIGQ
jgi:hypothetical protein